MGTLISVSTDYAPFRKIIFLTFVKREEIMRTKLSSVPDPAGGAHSVRSLPLTGVKGEERERR